MCFFGNGRDLLSDFQRCSHLSVLSQRTTIICCTCVCVCWYEIQIDCSLPASICAGLLCRMMLTCTVFLIKSTTHSLHLKRPHSLTLFSTQHLFSHFFFSHKPCCFRGCSQWIKRLMPTSGLYMLKIYIISGFHCANHTEKYGKRKKNTLWHNYWGVADLGNSEFTIFEGSEEMFLFRPNAIMCLWKLDLW